MLLCDYFCDSMCSYFHHIHIGLRCLLRSNFELPQATFNPVYSSLVNNTRTSMADLVVYSSSAMCAASPASSAAVKRMKKVSVDKEVVGELQFVVIVAQPRGRWSDELKRPSQASKHAKSLVLGAVSKGPPEVFGDFITERIVGVGVAESWRLVRSSAGHEQTYALIRAAIASHPKQHGQRFVEQRLVASAVLCGGPQDMPKAWLQLAPAAIFRQFCRGCQSDCQFRVTSGAEKGSMLSWASLRARWSNGYKLSVDNGFCMYCWQKLATALALGQWFGDVVVVPRRSSVAAGPESIAFTACQPWPSRRVMLSLMKDPKAAAAVIKHPGPMQVNVDRVKKGYCKAFNPLHLVSALRVAANLKSQADMKRNLVYSASFLDAVNPRQLVEGMIGDVAENMVPSPQTLRRARVHLDAAAMLWTRSRTASRKDTASFRYLSFDASPQRGWEMFGSVERLVTLEQLLSEKPEVTARRLPLTVLNASKQKLQDKVMAHIHQVTLMCGRDIKVLRKVNREVRQCITDMGVELGIGDFPDVLPEFFGQQQDQQAARGFLYPLALVIPGPQHILDTVLQHGLSVIPWWPEWQARAKILCQFVHKVTYRSDLQRRVLEAAKTRSDLNASELVASLSKGCDKFAAWRWKTLVTVTKSLRRMERALRMVGSVVTSASELASKDSVSACIVLEAMTDSDFWVQVSCLNHLVEPVAEFSAWLQGCKCHEPQLLLRQQVSCPWKGCRAPELPQRVSKFMEQMADVRNFVRKDEQPFGQFSENIAQAASAILASVVVKFAWVNETPYIIWQAGLTQLKRFVFFWQSAFGL